MIGVIATTQATPAICVAFTPVLEVTLDLLGKVTRQITKRPEHNREYRASVRSMAEKSRAYTAALYGTED